MAKVLEHPEDAVLYVNEMLRKYPNGLLILGPAGSGKSTLLKALLKLSELMAVEGDHYGKNVKVKGVDQWHISWDKLPAQWQVVAAVPDNIEQFKDQWDIDGMALLLLDVTPERWIETMRRRAAVEKHNWTELFKQYANYTPAQASKKLGELITELRSRVPEFGDRVYTIRTANWPGYDDASGRTKLPKPNVPEHLSIKSPKQMPEGDE